MTRGSPEEAQFNAYARQVRAKEKFRKAVVSALANGLGLVELVGIIRDAAEEESAMRVQVDRVVYDGGTVAMGYGYVLDEQGQPTEERVAFGGDWRPMRDLAGAVEDGNAPVAEVEDWQILG